jgi:hypothetical protein
MKKKLKGAVLLLFAMAFLPISSRAQTSQENWQLAIDGHPGQAPILRVQDKSYVDIERLARIINGSPVSNGNQSRSRYLP